MFTKKPLKPLPVEKLPSTSVAKPTASEPPKPTPADRPTAKDLALHQAEVDAKDEPKLGRIHVTLHVRKFDVDGRELDANGRRLDKPTEPA